MLTSTVGSYHAGLDMRPYLGGFLKNIMTYDQFWARLRALKQTISHFEYHDHMNANKYLKYACRLIVTYLGAEHSCLS